MQLTESIAHRCLLFFFLMIRRPPRSTLDRSSAASDVYKRQDAIMALYKPLGNLTNHSKLSAIEIIVLNSSALRAVSYTHLRAHETVLDLVCRLLLEKKKTPE